MFLAALVQKNAFTAVRRAVVEIEFFWQALAQADKSQQSDQKDKTPYCGQFAWRDRGFCNG
jgi:hypothetical protein